ncbi:MAG TPA: carboxymuconolactone decarboxylase family protein [Steroidobacteraceae bacterium]|nr:carboxymuconolactone decarboxylase family protein [Steroidobacteraceae bacterium]
MRARTKVAPLLLTSATLLLIATSVLGAEQTFTPRLQTPRVAPLGKEERTPEQQALLASRPDFNVYKTLAHDVDLYNRWSPLGRFVLDGSSLPPREREIVMLRMGWLCQSEYEWAQHARIAKAQAGLSNQDVHRIAEGPAAAGWSDFERTLLRMVDELRYDTMISDATWNALRARYSVQQVIEALYTAAQYQLVSMALNTLGVQLDPGLEDRLPKDVPLPALATQPQSPRLKQPRVPPLAESEWSEEQRKLIAEQKISGPVLNLYKTMLNHPTLYGPRYKFGSYLQRDSLLPPKTRELLILRTAALTGAEYEWGHHVEAAQKAGFSAAEIRRIKSGPDASGWSEEHAAVLRAADELRRETFVSDRTWATLAKHYDTKRLIEIIYTSGGYTMTALAINSLGIQLEPGFPRFP